ncbi:MAG: beta-lactamase family protein [Vicinamibacteria bacterium]|nr:beta-lactamase family protein [Vicinamibacteria bacterium]
MRAFLVALALATMPLAVGTAAPDSLLYSRLESYLDALRVQAGIPGMSAAIVGDTDIVWERGFGRQDLGRSIATQPDTPFHIDGLGETLTATLVLQCVEQGKLSLDDPIGNYDSGSPDPGATIRQLLAHTSSGLGGETFSYRPERLESLRGAVRECTGDSYRETLANLLDRLAMRDSVPGPDAVTLVPPAEGIPDEATSARYSAVLARLTTSYLVIEPGQASPFQHSATTVTTASGVVSTVRDLAQFDLALKQGLLLTPDTLALAWSTPAVPAVQGLPHGLGWFVQTYNGQVVVWQFGVSESSSSFLITLPSRRLTMILLANSDGLVKPFVLTPGDVLASPFARVFLGLLGP